LAKEPPGTVKDEEIIDEGKSCYHKQGITHDRCSHHLTVMRISNSDWKSFIRHLTAVLENFNVPERESQKVFAFVECTESGIVDIVNIIVIQWY
jgi:hypothetical protein